MVKDTVSRVGRITRYVVVPSELITPVSQLAAGGVVKVTRLVGTKPVARGAQRLKEGVSSGVSVAQGRVALVRVTRFRVRRHGDDEAAAAVSPGSEQAASPAPDPSDAPSSAPDA